MATNPDKEMVVPAKGLDSLKIKELPPIG